MSHRGTTARRGVCFESLENRQLMAVTLGPLKTTGFARIDSVATDSSGNIFAVGEFSGTTTFDTADKVKLTAIGDQDGFVMRIAASNGATTVRRLDVTSAPMGTNKIVTFTRLIVKDGHVTTVGIYSGNIDLDPTSGVANATSRGEGDSFVLDLSTSKLAYNWSTTFGGTGEDDPEAVGRDSKGNTWVTGVFQNTITFTGTTHQLKSTGSYDADVAKFDPTGKYLFSAHIGGSGDDVFRSLAIDSKDNVYFGGQFQKTIDTNPSSTKANLTTSGTTTSAMLVELTSAGAFKASKGFTDDIFATVSDLAFDSKGQLDLMGNFGGHLDADPSTKVSTLTTQGGNDIWVEQFDPSLNKVWTFGFGGKTGSDQGYDLFVDSKNQVYVSGTLQDTADLNPSSAKANLTDDGAGDGFVACYTSAGKYDGAVHLGGTGYSAINSVARSTSGLVFGGAFQNSVDLAPRKVGSAAPTPNLLSSDSGDAMMFLIAPSLLGAT